jgi:hypothetical protein
MNPKILLGILFLFLYSGTASVQQRINDTAFKSIKYDTSVDTVFNSTRKSTIIKKEVV